MQRLLIFLQQRHAVLATCYQQRIEIKPVNQGQAFFNKRYLEARIDPDGSIALKSSDGSWVDFEQLTPAARDTVYLALQITLLELAIQKMNLPVFMDNPVLRLDETAAAVAIKAMKKVSERTQVLLLSSQRAPAQFADHSLNLE